MVISVKFFANLQQTVGLKEGAIEARGVSSALDVWNASAKGTQLPANLIVSVNSENVDVDHPVRDGDKVAFFPSVTGG
jgi:molybdopterin synthase sulfur carrier subunit